jgi:hypothetical protein
MAYDTANDWWRHEECYQTAMTGKRLRSQKASQLFSRLKLTVRKMPLTSLPASADEVIE